MGVNVDESGCDHVALRVDRAGRGAARLADRDEVLSYTQIEYRRRGDDWEPFPESSNGEDSLCDPSDCRREPSPLNTDDNALIEFSAPMDLIGFQRYEGYLANIYSPDWPYGRLIERIRGLEGVTRTETMVVLSTPVERPRIALDAADEFVARPSRRSGARGRGR